MTFWLSKVLWFVVAPGNLLLLGLLAGFLLLLLGWRRTGGWLAGLSTAVLLAIAVLPMGPFIGILEDRFPQYTNRTEPVDGIIVLGGSVSVYMSIARGQVSYGYGERLTEFVTLAHEYPDARLVFTGGGGSADLGPVREADVVHLMLTEIGFDADKVTYERESRNTFENAKFAKELVKPGAGERWLLVTSAFHMPRAIGCFRRVGWDVTAYPVDYMTDGSGEYGLGFNLSSGLRALELALHEFIGMAAYYMMDRTSDLFPAPHPES
jgi:uncharacterized SAM-binding protein YcdF (DUF218 family)